MYVGFVARVLVHEIAVSTMRSLWDIASLHRGIVFADLDSTQHATYYHYQSSCDPRKPDKGRRWQQEPYFQDEKLNELYARRVSIVPIF